MQCHAFFDAVDIHAPDKDPGAQFYAWVWHKHFPGEHTLTNGRFFSAANQELADYHAIMVQGETRLEIKFETADDHLRFVLTWQGA